MKKLKSLLFAIIAIILLASIGHPQEYPKEYWQIELERSNNAIKQITAIAQQWQARKTAAETQLAAIKAREEQKSKKEAVTEGPAPDSGVEASGD